MDAGFGIFNVWSNSQGQAGFELDLFSVPIGRRMPSAGERDRSIVRDPGTDTSDETAILRTGDFPVEPREQPPRVESLRSQRSDRTNRKHPIHRSLESLAANISDHDQERTIALLEHLVEVAANFSSRQVGGFDVEAREGREIERN